MHFIRLNEILELKSVVYMYVYNVLKNIFTLKFNRPP